MTKIIADNEPLRGWLDFLWLELTPRCNLKCSHCYASSGPLNNLKGTISRSDWVGVLSQSAELGCSKVQFTGGEPTLVVGLSDLLNAAKKLDYKYIEVFTNGTLLNNQICSVLAAHGARLAFSLYSCVPSVHDTVTNVRGSCERTISGLEMALERGIEVRVGIVDTGSNSETIEETKEFLATLGVKQVGVDRQRNIGRGGTENSPQDLESELCGNCWKGQMVVDSDGNVFPCIMSRHIIIGNVQKSLLRDLVYGDELSGFRQRIRERHVEEKLTANCGPWCQPTCPPSTYCPPTCLPGCTPVGPCMPNCSPNPFPLNIHTKFEERNRHVN